MLLNNNITRASRKAESNTKRNIDKEPKKTLQSTELRQQDGMFC